MKPDESVVLICERREVDELTRGLIRIGIDDVVGWATAASVEAVTAETRTATPEIGPDGLDAAVARGATLLDVRFAAEHEHVSIDGGFLLPYTRLRERMRDVPEGDLVVMCGGGVRSAMACGMLERAGRTVTNLRGGMQAVTAHQRRMATSGG